jgi:pyridoxine 5-phosphate synthase
MVQLGVNIDHVATLRQVRLGTEPDPVFAALVCVAAGADSIVAHLREDRRHIREQDIFLIKKVIKTKFNLEMSVAPGIVEIACELKPVQVTLVPEKRKELTTEGGLDIAKEFSTVKFTVEKLKKHGIDVSLFIDPNKAQIDAAQKSGVNMIELHTGQYAGAKNKFEEKKRFQEIKIAADYAKTKGIKVFAGHGLNYNNVSLIAGIKSIEELNIGYSIICRAIITGLARAVKEMRYLIEQAQI